VWIHLNSPNWNNKENDDLNAMKFITWIHDMNKHDLASDYYSLSPWKSFILETDEHNHNMQDYLE